MDDWEIAKTYTLKPIQEIAGKLDIPEEALEIYGRFKAKLNLRDTYDPEKRGTFDHGDGHVAHSGG